MTLLVYFNQSIYLLALLIYFILDLIYSTTMLSLFEKYESYWYILKYNQEMIRFSEVKAGFIISIFGILFGLLFNSIDQVKLLVTDSIFAMSLAGIFVLFALMSFYYSFLCFIPRFENKNPTSVVYFGDIVNDFPTYPDYHNYVENIMNDEKEMSIQLAEQIHTNAVIATKKFRAVSKSIRLLLYAVLTLMLTVILSVVF
jgi:hypothetical protein